MKKLLTMAALAVTVLSGCKKDDDSTPAPVTNNPPSSQALSVNSDIQVKFKIDGPGKIVGVGNANPRSLESYEVPKRNAWRGRCMVIIQSQKKNGQIVLHASSRDLKPANILINSNPKR